MHASTVASVLTSEVANYEKATDQVIQALITVKFGPSKGEEAADVLKLGQLAATGRPAAFAGLRHFLVVSRRLSLRPSASSRKAATRPSMPQPETSRAGCRRIVPFSHRQGAPFASRWAAAAAASCSPAQRQRVTSCGPAVFGRGDPPPHRELGFNVKTEGAKPPFCFQALFFIPARGLMKIHHAIIVSKANLQQVAQRPHHRPWAIIIRSAGQASSRVLHNGRVDYRMYQWGSCSRNGWKRCHTTQFCRVEAWSTRSQRPPIRLSET